MPRTFREFMNQKERRLAIFDFDGTLAFTPIKPAPNEPQHGWGGKDWWGSPESLQPPFYNHEVNQEVLEAFKKAKSDPDTKAVLLTGRRGIVSHQVRNTLQQHGLYGKRVIPASNPNAIQHHTGNEHPEEMSGAGHEEYYSGDHIKEPDYPMRDRGRKAPKPDSSTLAHKIYVIQKKLMHDEIEEVEVWEDREDHVPHFIQLLKKLKNDWPNVKKTTLHRVFPDEGGHIIHIPVY